MAITRLSCATALAALLAASSAYAADNADDTVTIKGNQAKTCVLNLPTGTSDSEIVIADLDGAEDDAKLNVAATGSFAYGGAYCNTAHFATLIVTKMTRGGSGLSSVQGGSDAFKNEIHFIAALKNWFAPLSANTATTGSQTGAVNGAFHNDASAATTANPNDALTVEITTETHANPLLHGVYTGDARITLQAQP